MQKVKTWVRNNRKKSLFLAIIFGFYLWYDMPLVSKDPTSPFFVESLFRMRHYNGNDGALVLRDKVLPKLFPVGTPKEYVDYILVEKGGGHIIPSQAFIGMFTYRYMPLYLLLTPDQFDIRVYYNPQNKVEAIIFGWKRVVGSGYKPQPTRKAK